MGNAPSEPPTIDRKTRMQIPFEDLTLRPPEERVHDFDAVVLPLTPERAMREASRCIHCPEAPCKEACPGHNDIPEAMWLIENGKFIEAAQLYRQTSSLPEICGRVCPHDELCQGACVRNKRKEPVLTGALEAFVTDYERQNATVTVPVGKPTGKRVAIIGAGPTGLTCAEQLVQQGHAVTIFDTKPAPGGLLLYGIPNFKLTKDVVLNRWEDLEKTGVKFVGNTYLGKNKTVDNLFEEGFDAIYIGVGAGKDSMLEIPGEDLPGVFEATDFLIRANVDPKYWPAGKTEKPKIGNRVVVIGGGDTASDCLRSALRLGAKDVTCLYRRTENEMPGNKKDRQMTKDEGAKYRFLTQPVKFIAGKDGKLAAVECIEMQLGEPDESGRRRPVPIEGSNFSVAADTAILALGYWPDPIIGETTPNLETQKRGLIKVTDEETGTTSREGVFAGGDAVTGPNLVVSAMVAGRKAAKAIGDYLFKKK